MRTETALKQLEDLAAMLQKRAAKLREAKPRKGKEFFANGESLHQIHQHVTFLQDTAAKFIAVRDGVQRNRR